MQNIKYDYYYFQHEKQYQLQLEREQQIRLMIEKEQRYIDQLRSEIAISPSDKKTEKLNKAESNLQKLHTILQNHVRTQNEVNIKFVKCDVFSMIYVLILILLLFEVNVYKRKQLFKFL